MTPLKTLDMRGGMTRDRYGYKINQETIIDGANRVWWSLDLNTRNSSLNFNLHYDDGESVRWNIGCSSSHRQRSGAPTSPVIACGVTPCRRSRPLNSVFSGSSGLDYAERSAACFVVASGGALSGRYGHDGPGVWLDDGQTEDEGVPSQGGRGDALFWRMSQYLT